ncbi:cyanophycin synthetase [Longitalea arenae]|uniref:cyanophycin synthetase n=1 Tax=Longitalea arenae TaxID=2812558 RepID=UPI001968112D|nr:cyanophycin synthetase [Longitalea arenae]
MKVIDIKATQGPNYWSVRRKELIVMLLDLEEMEDQPTNLIPGFYDRLVTLMPSLQEHRCSKGVKGGFFKRVQEGTWMGHVIEHIALELQNLAGMKTGFGRTRDAGQRGLYHIVFAYEDLESGKYSAEAAVRIAEALIKGMPYNIQQDVNAIKELAAKRHAGPSTSAILQEAVKRNIPVIRHNDDSFIQLGYGCEQQRIQATIASTTSCLAVDIAGDKSATKELLQSNYIPVPEGRTLTHEAELLPVIEQIGYPVVIKPLNGNQGKGATTNIRNYNDALAAFRLAKEFGPNLICEKHISGSDYRILVINYRFCAAALRTPASVTGDGIHTIRELIDLENEDPRRGNDHENVLTRIRIDEGTVELINKQGYSLDGVPAKNDYILLKTTANLSTGGTAEDVTGDVHPHNIALFERIARLVGLNICGIDIMATDISVPITDTGGAVLEVNAAPGFRMHISPSKGQPQNVGKAVIDMLFPQQKDGRIPIMAVTGTNGKTTTTRLLAHITKQAGYKVGFTTTDGVYIHDQMILKGDCTGPESAKTVLKDPGVNMAVLECARGGILRAGLGFDQCDIAIVTNIAEDHLGLQGIDSLEKLARVKSVVPESVHAGGYAILNADDELVYKMRERLHCKLAYFTMNPDNMRVQQHLLQGGLAAVYENGFITIRKGQLVPLVITAKDIPITFSGAAEFNISNILPAALAAYIQGVSARCIEAALISFIPCPETIPGRMNVFDFNYFKLIVDYAHNSHGVKAIASFIRSLQASTKIGVIAGIGDRRDEDITSLGAEAAAIFDELIIRHDDDLRGRDPQEIDQLICKGIHKVAPGKKITIVSSELKAVEVAIKNAVENSITVFFADNIKAVIGQIRQFLSPEMPQARAVA